MNSDPDALQEMASSLLDREREILSLRLRHERTTTWLSVAQTLPTHFDVQLPVREIYARVSRSLIAGLKYQQVVFFEVVPGALRRLGAAGQPDRALAPEARAVLDAAASGFCNQPSTPGLDALGAAFGLHRFVWSRADVPGGPPTWMAAGFDRDRAPFYLPLDDGDQAHFQNLGQQFGILLHSTLLLREVRESNTKLEALNVTLEQKVDERTRDVRRRGRDMRLVLDNVAQGFVTIDRRGVLAQERSASIDRWFGPYDGELTFAGYMSAFDAEFGAAFNLGHEALTDDILPRELCLEQLPKRLRFGGREFRCAYTRIEEDAQDCGLLIVINDVTAQLAGAHKEAEQREVMALFQALMRDRIGCLAFFEEATEMMERLSVATADRLEVKALLHTLKGNAGVVNLQVLADLCHRVEDELDEIQAVPREASMNGLFRHWLTLTEALEALLGEGNPDQIEIDGAELERLCEEVRLGAPGGVVLDRLRFLRLEPVERALGRLAKYARELGVRLGKGEVLVAINAHGVRLDPGRWASLWTELVHLVRNAVDHGLETPEERRQAGKPARSRLRFEANVTGGKFVVGVADDGRGIAWDEVRRVAAERGLPNESEHDLTQALFAPNFTTRREVSATSGRGIGLAAVLERVEHLGGTIKVDSRAGLGSSWFLSFPLVAPAGAESVMASIRKQPRAEPSSASPPPQSTDRP
jgi:HPt (histidine-containing phosphotransfer) domain-containing protein